VELRRGIWALRVRGGDGITSIQGQGWLRLLPLAAVAATLLGGANLASAQILFYEDFGDTTLTTNGASANGTIENGIVNYLDASATARSRFSVVQTFDLPVMTFSFDIVAPVFQTAPEQFEVLFRAGIGAAQNTMSSSEFILEANLWRNNVLGGAYVNNGNETIFVIANNKATDLVFTSPIDATSVTLTGFQYISYVHNKTTDVFGVVKGATAFTDRTPEDPLSPGTMTRFGIGTSSNGHQGGFSLDNVLVLDIATFERPGVGDSGTPGDVDGDDDVDMDDFAIIQSHFQQTVTMRTEGDLTFDNFVDFRDFRQWKNNAPAPVLEQWAALGVPEPSTAMLAGLALAGGIAAKRRRSSGR
jgi:hypothetical protein